MERDDTYVNRIEFQDALRRSGRYETRPAPPRGPSDRLLGRSDVFYYLHLFSIVLQAGIKAHRKRYNRDELAESSFRTLRLVERTGGLVTIEGARNLEPKGSPLVVMANHMSTLETFLLPSILLAFGDMVTVVKQSLMRYPLFGPILQAGDAIAVTRKDPKDDLRAVLDQGASRLAAGRSALIFPQATRSPVFRPAAMNTLAVKLARRAGVPVVPAALRTDFQGVGRVVRDCGPLNRSLPIRFAFGPPLPVEGNGKHAQEEAMRFITSRLRDWNVPMEENTP